MRILYVLPAEGFGGAERQAVYHIHHLAKWGIDVIPLVGPGERIEHELGREGITEYEYTTAMMRDFGRPYHHVLELSRYMYESVSTWFRAQELLQALHARFDFDAAFATRVAGWATLGPAAARAGIPQIWRVGARPSDLASRTAFRWFSSMFRPDGIVCNCQSIKDAVSSLSGAPSWVVYNGVDAERFSPDGKSPELRSQLGISSKATVVGVSARPAPGKGLESLAEALERLAIPAAQLRVLVAGEYGWRTYFENYFSERGLGDQVSFLGHIEEIEVFLRSCDFVVLPADGSSTEGMPNALLEAMAMQRPVVGTAVGGISEVIHDRVNGLLVAPDNAEDLASAIEELHECPDARKEMGIRARNDALTRFSLKASVERIAETIHNVVETRRLRAFSGTRAGNVNRVIWPLGRSTGAKSRYSIFGRPYNMPKDTEEQP